MGNRKYLEQREVEGGSGRKKWINVMGGISVISA
jgi:hypothetical protein